MSEAIAYRVGPSLAAIGSTISSVALAHPVVLSAAGGFLVGFYVAHSKCKRRREEDMIRMLAQQHSSNGV